MSSVNTECVSECILSYAWRHPVYVCVVHTFPLIYSITYDISIDPLRRRLSDAHSYLERVCSSQLATRRHCWIFFVACLESRMKPPCLASQIRSFWKGTHKPTSGAHRLFASSSEPVNPPRAKICPQQPRGQGYPGHFLRSQ